MSLESIQREMEELEGVLSEVKDGPASSPRPVAEQERAAVLEEAVADARTSIQEAVAALHKAGVALQNLSEVLTGKPVEEEVSALSPNDQDTTEPRALRDDPSAPAAKPKKEAYPVGDVFPDDIELPGADESAVAVEIPPGVPLPKE
jgi:hypothetical protein